VHANAALPQSRASPLFPSVSSLALDDTFLNIYTRVQIPTVAHDQFSSPRAIMSSPANADSEGSSFKPFTKVERIQQLNDIDKARSTQHLLPFDVLTVLRA